MPKRHQCAAPGCEVITTNPMYCSQECAGKARTAANATKEKVAKPQTKPCPNRQCLGRGSWVEFSGPPNVRGDSTPVRKTCPDCSGSGKIPV